MRGTYQGSKLQRKSSSMQFGLISRLFLVISTALISWSVFSCQAGGQLTENATHPFQTGQQVPEPDPGTQVLPGSPTLIEGARITLDASEPLPPAPSSAQAGVDFASNRFVCLFETSPTALALAPYLGGGGDGPEQQPEQPVSVPQPEEGKGVGSLSGTGPISGDGEVLPTDNLPLVQHPYYRLVSENLAAKYGLEIDRRVFYKGLDFAVCRLPSVSEVADLDAMMLQVLRENVGLVRAVEYDFFCFTNDAGPENLMEAQEVARLFEGQPAGFIAGQMLEASAPVRTSSAAPNDPYHTNRPMYSNWLPYDPGGSSTGGTWTNWRVGTVDGQAWNTTTGNANVLVAVIDTGVRASHEDLDPNTIDPNDPTDANTIAFPQVREPGVFTDTYNKDNDPNDGDGHGTKCAGCIGAKGNNSLGIPGMCWDVTILPIKVFSDAGVSSGSATIEGVLLAHYLGADILSLSLGSSFPSQSGRLAYKLVTDDGTLVFASAGNDNTSARQYPAGYPEVVAVGATTLVNSSNNEDFSTSGGVLPVATRYDARTDFSNYGDWVEIAAPGTLGLTTSHKTMAGAFSDTAYSPFAGTSMACPNVAGCAALLWGYISDPTAQEVKALLLSSATEMTHINNGADPHGFIDDSTNGTVRFCNVYQALQLYENASYPYTAPDATWHDPPTGGTTLTGSETLQVSITPNGNTIRRVVFTTPVRYIGTATSASGNGYWETIWDTAFEFNKDWPLTATVYDDHGHAVSVVQDVTTSNTHTTLTGSPPTWSEDFTGVANDAIPASWYEFDGNSEATTNTSWGAATDSANPGIAPSMHSSGTTATYADSSNDWLFPPILDLTSFSSPTLDYKCKYHYYSGDGVYVLGTYDDLSFYTLGPSGSSNVWNTITGYNLGYFAGRELRLMFALEANDDGGALTGLWVDDLQVNGASGTPPSITINSPANGSAATGVTTLNITLSGGAQRVRLSCEPADINSSLIWNLTDGTHNVNWDSRWTYNGGALLTLTVYNSSSNPTLESSAQLALSANNSTRDATWFDGFENYTDLGGTSGSSLISDWFVWWYWGTIKWRTLNSQSHSGSQCAYMGPSGGGNYTANTNQRMYGPVHDLSSTMRPYLRLWHKLDSADTDDVGELALVRYDGTDTLELPLAEFRDSVGSWTRLTYDLTPYKSDQLRFKFAFTSDSDGTVGTGWYIDDFEIIDANPTLTNLVPSTGLPSDTITINGSNFGTLQDDSTVTFAASGGGRVAATVTSWSDTAIQVTVPATVASGNVIVNVLGFDSNGLPFTYANPTLSTVSPDRTNIGSTVTLSGQNFGSSQGAGDEVRFYTSGGYVAAVSYSSWSNAEIVCTVPAGAASNLNGVWVHAYSQDSNKLPFTVVLGPPVLDNLTQQ